MQKLPTVQELFNLAGKIFLVAGGSHHLGRDIAVALAEAGADGVITSRNESLATKTADEINKATGRKVTGLSLNAIYETEVKKIYHTIIKEFGQLDIVVNCVGGGGLQQTSAIFEETPLDAWQTMHQQNLRTTFLLCKHAVTVMKKQKRGVIINIASIAGVIGRDRRVYPKEMVPQSIGYASAKSAVIGFSRDLAAYLGPYGIRVNTISPGGFMRKQPPEFIEAYSRKVPLGRMGLDGVDIKGPVLYLASDASSYVTGQNLVVDGGFTIWQ